MPKGTLTEVFCQADSRDQLRLLVPTLAQLSRESRWITLVAPPCIPNPRQLEAAGVDTRKFQIIHTRSIQDYWSTLEQTLANGRSSAVLAWIADEFDDRHRDRLKSAATQGQSVSFVLRELGRKRQSAQSTVREQPEPAAEKPNRQLCLSF